MREPFLKKPYYDIKKLAIKYLITFDYLTNNPLYFAVGKKKERRLFCVTKDSHF